MVRQCREDVQGAFAGLLRGRRQDLLRLFLAVVDRATPGRSWFVFPIGPLTALAGALVSLVLVLARVARLSTLSLIALSLLTAGLLVVAVEAALSYFLTNELIVSWSMLSLACVLPPALLLLYLQRRLRRSGPEIRKRFHL